MGLLRKLFGWKKPPLSPEEQVQLRTDVQIERLEDEIRELEEEKIRLQSLSVNGTAHMQQTLNTKIRDVELKLGGANYALSSLVPQNNNSKSSPAAKPTPRFRTDYPTNSSVEPEESSVAVLDEPTGEGDPESYIDFGFDFDDLENDEHPSSVEPKKEVEGPEDNWDDIVEEYNSYLQQEQKEIERQKEEAWADEYHEESEPQTADEMLIKYAYEERQRHLQSEENFLVSKAWQRVEEMRQDNVESLETEMEGEYETYVSEQERIATAKSKLVNRKRYIDISEPKAPDAITESISKPFENAIKGIKAMFNLLVAPAPENLDSEVQKLYDPNLKQDKPLWVSPYDTERKRLSIEKERTSIYGKNRIKPRTAISAANERYMRSGDSAMTICSRYADGNKKDINDLKEKNAYDITMLKLACQDRGVGILNLDEVDSLENYKKYSQAVQDAKRDYESYQESLENNPDTPDTLFLEEMKTAADSNQPQVLQMG